MSRRPLLLAGLVTVALALGGCANPDAPSRQPETTSPGSPGEPRPPSPTPPAEDAPPGARATPQAALLAFATLYVNWDYRTITAGQHALAGMSVGPARAAELQAAASSGSDETLRTAQIHNSGAVLSVAPDRREPGRWVLVTREQTSGSGEYEGLQPSDHVTLARVAQVRGGYAVSEWLPQS